MFNMKSKVARDVDIDLDDQAKVKFAMTSLGYHDDSDEGLSPYSSNRFFDAIKRFQKDLDLKIDGIINPEGETHRAIKTKLEEDERTGNAFSDIWRNFEDMKKDKTKGADKYFHCKANYEASDRGWEGAILGDLVDFKEIKDVFKYGVDDSLLDIKANHYGQQAARSGKYTSSRDACAVFRVDGIGDEY